MGSPNPTLVAGGTIQPAAFVKLSGAADNAMLQAGAGDVPIGIASEAQFYPPVNDASGNALYPVYAAAAGQSCRVYGAGEICNVQADGTGFAHGDKLKPGAVGVATATTTAGDVFGAVALETTPANALGRVKVQIGKV